MNKEAKLILDNNAHKCSVTIDGKQQKVTIAPFDEMSLIEANDIIRQINNIFNAGYTFLYIVKMLEISESLPVISRYSLKSLQIVIKLLYEEDLQHYINSKQIEKENENTQRSLVILNVGCTSVGKTLGNLYAIIPHKYVVKFFSLASIKESTNFSIQYVVNPYNKKIKNIEEYEVEVKLKDCKQIKEDIDSLGLEALQEILDTIKTEVKSNNNNDEIWDIAMNAGCDRLKINKNKTFDITSSATLENERSILEKILIKSIRNYSTKSISYNEKFSDEQIKNDIINDVRNNIFKLNIQEISYVIYELDEFKDLMNDIYTQLEKVLARFSSEYNIRIDEKKIINIKKSFDDNITKKLIGNIFGDKKQRKNKEFFSIDALILDAKIFFANKCINDGNQLILVDGLGINQGQIPNGNEKKVAYNRVHVAIQECNPDMIVYNTRIDTKDDYIIDVIKDLNEQGYKNRVFVVYGRFDTVLESYCAEEGIEINDLTEEEFYTFVEYINTEYLNKELISLGELENKKIYLCDKRCKLSKYPLEQYKEYTPNEVLKNIINVFKATEKNEMSKLNKERIDKIIDIMNGCSIFSNVFSTFRSSIDDMVPMQYNLLRWNTLECAIRNMYYDGQGYGGIYPSITLKNCFAKLLNNDELKEVLKDEYDNVLKELLNQWINIAHTVMITSYKLEFSKLLDMRFDYKLRNMTSMTLTDERKYIIRNILSTCFKNGTLDGPIVLKQLTKYVLSNIIY
ncbi:hypothetical protein KPL40_05890 [Clostridium gasigenes]|uniref:hypothetical protein n=1 Tax=Clostridium gasigenes TaxID=94869 RepID=UPI001C0DFA86|nr:hypothetical protein [Clostridium gasigenes]MBU3131977.1 hypothetical protein [Clostridium gasigenes]